MPFTPLEHYFLKRLSDAPWVSPPLFDHILVVRLVEAGYVQTEALSSGEVQYKISDAGQIALENA